jgi:hypothetical protein
MKFCWLVVGGWFFVGGSLLVVGGWFFVGGSLLVVVKRTIKLRTIKVGAGLKPAPTHPPQPPQPPRQRGGQQTTTLPAREAFMATNN